MFINNEFNLLDVRKKVQNTTKILFPKLYIQSSSHSQKIKPKIKQKTKPISSDNNLTTQSINQILNNNQKPLKDNLYSMNVKDILIPKKNKQFIEDSLIKQGTMYKIDSIQNNKLYQTKLRATQRDYKQLRSTFVARKSDNISPFQVINIKETILNTGKKSIGHYTIVKQLGHGGFATVYEVTDNNNTGQKYAMKSYNLTESFECYQNEVKVGEYFKTYSNQLKKSNQNSQSIVQYIEKIRIGKKGYIIQQLAGQCFSKMLSEIKGVFYNKQRVYQVRFLPFYQQLKKRQCFVSVMIQICLGVEKLNNAGFVHCDLKLENILIELKDNETNDISLPIARIIDFGSTFQFANGLPKITITPEYMPPQLLMQFSKNQTQQSAIIYQKIDVWSIGCIMLEIFTGLPLWFKYKCKITYNDKNRLDLSIFALTNRDYSKIIKKQQELCGNLLKNIPFVCQQWQRYRGLLRQIFVVDPVKRISVQDLLRKLNEIK